VDNPGRKLTSSLQWRLAATGLQQEELERFATLLRIDMRAARPDTNVIATRKKRLFVCRSGATDIPEQSRVVHVRDSATVQSEPPRQPGRNEAASHGSLGRVAHPKVGDQ
jgi:hypothetical protein